jgi:serine/threonine-protein kinase
MERFGTWELESVIAVGGMGEVWRALRDADESAVAPAAVKRIHTHLQRNDEARALFAGEQALLMGLPAHGNVVAGIEVGTVEDRPYVAMALAPGGDLRRIAADGALPRARVLTIVRGAAAAAAHVSDHGFVHGDLCPGNLVIGAADHPVLVDFGVARRIGEGGPMRGTHAYMAPEQVRGEVWTPATDVFALGVILWELTAGARLFHKGPPWLTMAAVTTDPVPALADPALDLVARGALTKDPALRTPTARALLDQLQLLAL